MSRRVLIVEPDATVRRILELALSSAGFAPSTTSTVEAARALLDGTPMEAAIVELRASNAEGADGVRALRADYPELPLVVTGTLLTPRVMQELIRARVDDVVPKPFTPREIVAALEHVLRNARTKHNGALEYSAAMSNARRALIEGRPRDAEAPLARARAVSPLDGEAMALFGMVCEVEGRDREADRAYRAALALRDDRITDDVSAREGLARLAAYDGARSVPAFEHEGRRSVWFVSESERPPAGVTPDVLVFTLGLTPSETGAVYARLTRDRRVLLTSTSAASERLVLRIARSFEGATVLG
jgi:DNA-binding NarL/FixJ family response regulator